MESKTKHRILGIVVLIGLVIILLPFFQGQKELPSEPILVKAPPFPDQAVQVTSTDVENNNPDLSQINLDHVSQPNSSELLNSSSSQTEKNIPSTNFIKTNKTKPNVIHTETKEDDIIDKKLDKKIADIVDEEKIQHEANVSLTTSGKINKNVKFVTAASISPTTHNKLHTRTTSNHKTFNNTDTNGLLKLQNPGWVIQIGSFKDKSNALKIVNRLRENGYKAFIQQVSTSLGNSTRVFVGPENKQNTARTLANQLEMDLHLHGIVISYKPLAL